MPVADVMATSRCGGAAARRCGGDRDVVDCDVVVFVRVVLVAVAEVVVSVPVVMFIVADVVVVNVEHPVVFSWATMKSATLSTTFLSSMWANRFWSKDTADA